MSLASTTWSHEILCPTRAESSGGGIKIDEGTLKKIAAICLFAWQGTGIFFVL
jgi:hypothetical protein